MLISFQITNLGEGLGPTFTLSDDFGPTVPSVFTKEELLEGVEIEVNDGATKVIVVSNGSLCKNKSTKEYLIPSQVSCNFGVVSVVSVTYM